MTNSPIAEPPVDLKLGAQRPRISHVPQYTSCAGDEAIELAAMAGLHLDDWQQYVLRHSMGERPDGKWAARSVGLVVGRQNGKGSILEARELWGLFLGGEQLIIHTAHLQKTATQHFERISGLIKQTPMLRKRVESMPRGKGAEAIRLKTGQTIFFATRSGGGGRGLTSDLIVFDEAMYLTETDVNALVPSLAARSMQGNIQLWYTGSAVDQMDTSQDGVPFAKIRESGLAKNRSVAFFEWSVEADGPWDVSDTVASDPEVHRLTNPSYNVRISPEWCEEERTTLLGGRGFRVERLGAGDWPDTSEDAARIIAREPWESAAERDPANRITGIPIFAVDANPIMTWSAIAVSGKRDDGLFNGAVIAHEPGTDWLVARCLALKAEHPRMRVVIHKQGPLGSHIDDFKRAKIRVIEATSEDYARACTGFIAGVAEGRFRYPFPQPDLSEAVGAARAKDGEAMKWTRKDAEAASIAPLVAVTLAYWGAEQGKGQSRLINLNDLD